MMFCKIKKALFRTVLASVFITSPTLASISETAATAGAIIGGAAVGAGAGALTYYKVFNNDSNQTTRAFVSCFVGLGFGGLAGYLFYKWFYGLTPSGMVTVATTLIQEVAADSLSQSFTSLDDLVAHTKLRFGTYRPLMQSMNILANNIKKLATASNAITLAQQEMQNNSAYAGLAQQCSMLVQQITALSPILKINLDAIIKQDLVVEATDLVQKVTTDSLSKTFVGADDIATHTTARFGTSWPLVLGRKVLSSNLKKLATASDNIWSAQQDILGNALYTKLIQQSNLLTQKIAALLPILEINLNTLVKHKKYDFQVQLYEKHQEEERNRKAQEAEAARNRKAQEAEAARNRWHEQQLQNNALQHESDENKKRRKQQDKILNQNQCHQVNLNVS